MIEIKTIASGSSGNAYYLSDGKTCILLECGIAFKKIQKAISFRMSGLSACLITHEHGDHSKAVKEMIRAGIDCYMSVGTANALELKTGSMVKIIKAQKQFRIGSWSILPFDTVHDCAEPLGFLLVSGENKILFLTDSAYCKYKFNGLTHILIEANYQDSVLQENIDNGIVEYGMKKRLLETHMSLNQTLGFLKTNDLSKVQEIHLIHLSDRNSDTEMMRNAVIKKTGKPVFINNNSI
jgi:phosphoribosyl 1,2-cyclic phosphodiesterase